MINNIYFLFFQKKYVVSFRALRSFEERTEKMFDRGGRGAGAVYWKGAGGPSCGAISIIRLGEKEWLE